MSKNAASADAIKNHVATVVEEVRLQAAPPPIVAEPVDETDYFDPSLYINRELSILEFQRRVLGDRRAMHVLRKFYPWYLDQLDVPKLVRNELCQTAGIDRAREIVAGIRNGEPVVA